MPNNPYTSPSVNPELDDQELKTAPPILVEHLRHTRPWVKFCSLVGLVNASALACIGLFILVVTFKNVAIQNNYLLVAFYIILSILFLIPSIGLSRYEKAITRLVITQELTDLEVALFHQRAFWKNIAIMILIIMIIYLVTIVFSTTVLIKH